jgi:hypothetical protein
MIEISFQLLHMHISLLVLLCVKEIGWLFCCSKFFFPGWTWCPPTYFFTSLFRLLRELKMLMLAFLFFLLFYINDYTFICIVFLDFQVIRFFSFFLLDYNFFSFSFSIHLVSTFSSSSSFTLIQTLY